ncbi:MAG: Low-specificity L-threonine aldolase, partial [uncultured Sphingosinicella sp.]
WRRACASFPTMPPPPAPKSWPRSLPPTGSIPLMTAMRSASASTAPFPSFSRRM